MIPSTETIHSHCGCVYVLTTGCDSPVKTIDVTTRCTRHGGSTVRLGTFIEAQLGWLLSIVLAYEEAAMVQALAAHPWALHYLAAQPEWQAYVAALRASQAS